MPENTFTFLVESSHGPLKGETKAVINAHVAKRAHAKRRARQQHVTPTVAAPFRQLREQCSHLEAPRTWRSPVCWDCGQWVERVAPAAPYHGNSDPFNTFPVKIDAKANYYLTFGRDFIENVVWNIGPRGWPSDAVKPVRRATVQSYHKPSPAQLVTTRKTLKGGHAIRTDLYGGRHSFNDSDSIAPEWHAAHASSILAYCANVMSSIAQNPHHHNDALEYSTRCMTALRECLQHIDDYQDIRAEELVYRLFRAEVVGGNFESAKVHAKHLQRLLERKKVLGNSDLEFLTVLMYSDNNYALGGGNRPLLDAKWLHDAFRQSWKEADQLFPADMSYEVRFKTGNDELDNILLAENKLFWHSSILSTSRLVASSTSWYWFTSQCEWIQNRMITYRLHLMSRRHEIESNGSKLSLAELFEECLILTSLIAMRQKKNTPMIQGIPLYSVSFTLLQQLSSSYNEMEERECSTINIRALLWMAFVAAVNEQKLHSELSKYGKHFVWRSRLGRLVEAMGLRSWLEMQAILSNFPYTEEELPLPDERWLQDAFIKMEDAD